MFDGNKEVDVVVRRGPGRGRGGVLISFYLYDFSVVTDIRSTYEESPKGQHCAIKGPGQIQTN